MTGRLPLVLAVSVLLIGLAPILGAVSTFIPAAHAVQPDEVLEDSALEARARVISRDIRCLVCQNQSIDDSNADLARDLRIIVRERLVAGDSDEEVKTFLVERYGDYVLLTPPFRIETLTLWIGPFVLTGIGGLLVVLWFRGRNKVVATGAATPATPRLSAEEKRHLDALMADDRPDDGDRP